MRSNLGRTVRLATRGVITKIASMTMDTVVTNAPASPTTPVVTVGTVTTTSIALSWTSTGADTYTVEWSADGGSTWSSVGEYTTNTATSVTDGSLLSNTGYDYRVRATNAFGNSGYGTASATTAALTPSWSLNFSSGTPSGYTLTRASSGTYVDSSGYVASASTNVARLTHNSSGSRLGLLVEQSRTNLCLQSEDFTTAGWGKAGCSVTGNSDTAPDNTTTADLLTENSSTGMHGLDTPTILSQGSGNSICFSVYAKKPSSNGRNCVSLAMELGAGGGYCGKRFDLTTGTVVGTDYNTNTTNLTNLTYGIENAGNGWYRCWVSVQVNTSSYFDFRISPMINSTTAFAFGEADYAGDNTSGILVWGAQVEKGDSMSSYIPTTTASVTRSDDLAHVLDSSITSWGDPGAMVVHFYPPRNAGTLISTDDASTAQVGIEASTTTAARAFWSSGSTATGTIGTGVQKAVHYWNGSTSKFCINGGTVQSGTNNLTIGNTDFVTLGAEATDSGGVPGTFSQYANCVIRKVEFYSGTLTDANLQTITT